MSAQHESLKVGECYLTNMGTVRRVMGLLPGRVQYQQRPGHRTTWANHRTDILDLRSFAFTVERSIPCDWTPETDE